MMFSVSSSGASDSVTFQGHFRELCPQHGVVSLPESPPSSLQSLVLLSLLLFLSSLRYISLLGTSTVNWLSLSSSFTDEDEGSECDVTSSPCECGRLVGVWEGGEKGDNGPRGE